MRLAALDRQRIFVTLVLPIVSVLYNVQTNSCAIQMGLKKVEPYLSMSQVVC